MDAKLAAEEVEKERLRLEKKAKKEKRKQELRDQKKIEELQAIHPDAEQLKSASPVKSAYKSSKVESAAGWSALAKLNLVLLVTALALGGGAMYLHSGGDMSRSGLASNLGALGTLTRQQGGRALDAGLLLLKRASELGTAAGDVLVTRALDVWEWGGGLAARLDRLLTDSCGDSWSTTKAAAGGAATCSAWELSCAGWELVRTEGPVYAALVAEQVNRLVAAVTGS
ncbi:uncharacterized protein LOC119111008 [Pollicipes pollicipes]|nr:uncharacterized protein LOC119111008 [Pollicipes pollicipes]